MKPWENLAQDSNISSSRLPSLLPVIAVALSFISGAFANATDERGLTALAEPALSPPGFLHVSRADGALGGMRQYIDCSSETHTFLIS